MLLLASRLNNGGITNMQTIDQTLAPLHLLSHPFYQAWMKGDLSRETLRDYAAQYYTHVDLS